MLGRFHLHRVRALERLHSVLLSPVSLYSIKRFAHDVGGWPSPRAARCSAKALSDLATEDAVFTCDVGLPTEWAARYLAMNGKRRLMGSFWHDSIANAMA